MRPWLSSLVLVACSRDPLLNDPNATPTQPQAPDPSVFVQPLGHCVKDAQSQHILALAEYDKVSGVDRNGKSVVAHTFERGGVTSIQLTHNRLLAQSFQASPWARDGVLIDTKTNARLWEIASEQNLDAQLDEQANLLVHQGDSTRIEMLNGKIISMPGIIATDLRGGRMIARKNNVTGFVDLNGDQFVFHPTTETGLSRLGDYLIGASNNEKGDGRIFVLAPDSVAAKEFTFAGLKLLYWSPMSGARFPALLTGFVQPENSSYHVFDFDRGTLIDVATEVKELSEVIVGDNGAILAVRHHELLARSGETWSTIWKGGENDYIARVQAHGDTVLFQVIHSVTEQTRTYELVALVGGKETARWPLNQAQYDDNSLLSPTGECVAHLDVDGKTLHISDLKNPSASSTVAYEYQKLHAAWAQ